MHTFEIRSVGFAVIAGALALAAGCAEVGGTRSGDVNDGGATTHPCNTAAATAIGALAGSLFGKGKGHLAGAAIGAGIGAFACIAYNYRARQIRDARAVEAQYQRERGALPTANTVETYQSSLLPGETVQAGSTATMQSRITILRGTHEEAPQLKEQLTLYSPEGKQLSTVTKDAASINGTGEYQTDFAFDLPKGIQEGRYTVQSTLYMDGKQVRDNKVPMLVVT
ncbi:MAG: hypothetical protein J0H27_16570 [Xanthomonadales bacterium]|nr:hypothetical protein [Xanthomonadales bacterium]OJY86250.1 MAG: hypothetical protein BGP23_13325 [Xanthomonadales bacterium 66-474]